MEKSFITNPVPGGKEACRKCGSFIEEDKPHVSLITETGEKVYWCEGHFNRYEHYYGLDKPLD